MSLSEKFKKDIVKIGEKYAFQDIPDLLKRIEHLPTQVALMPTATRPSTVKKQLKALVQILKKLIDTLQATSAQTKMNIGSTVQHYEDLGYKHIRSKNKGWYISTYEDDTYVAYQACLFTLQNIQPDSGGRSQRSIPKYVVFLLTYIYHAGTGNDPTCGWVDSGDDDHPGEHVGAFYEFLLDLTPALNELGIKLGKENTIGTACVLAIAHYNKILAEHPS